MAPDAMNAPEKALPHVVTSFISKPAGLIERMNSR